MRDCWLRWGLIFWVVGIMVFEIATIRRMDNFEKRLDVMQKDMEEKSKTGLLRTETVNRYSEGIQDQVNYIYKHFELPNRSGLQPKESDHVQPI